MFSRPWCISMLWQKDGGRCSTDNKPHGKFEAGDRFFVRDSGATATEALYRLHEHHYRLRLCKGLMGGVAANSETGQIRERVLFSPDGREGSNSSIQNRLQEWSRAHSRTVTRIAHLLLRVWGCVQGDKVGSAPGCITWKTDPPGPFI